MSTTTQDTNITEAGDRRISVRRQDDYFWLKRLADLTGEACLVVNKEMGIEFVDSKIFDLLKMAPLSDEDLTHLSQLTRVMAEQGYFGHGDPKIFEALISDLLVNQRLKQSKATQIINAVTPTGQHIDIRVSIGRDDSYLLLMRDCTEEELKRRALDTALQVGHSGYWYYNLKSLELTVRADSLRKHFSADRYSKLQEEGFMDVIHPDDHDIVRQSIKDAIKTATPNETQVRIICDDDEIHWLKSHVMPNIDEGGHVRSLSCFFMTITDRILSEKNLRDAQSEAESALKAKNEFLGRLSHEVRTPLNAVIGMADALVHNCKDEAILPQLTLIQNSAEKVMEMVDETLEHTKLADDAVELNIRTCSPSDLVQSVCRKWIERAKINQTEIACIISPDVPSEIDLDDYRYEQCLSNLLSNAIKFTPGGKIKVVLAMNGHGESRNLVLAVRDNGIGIAPDSIENIFKPFRQADKSISSRFGGTGLGLSIVKDLVNLMGGKLKVSSKIGKGTLFAMSVPCPSEVIIAEPVTEMPDIVSSDALKSSKETVAKPDIAPVETPPQIDQDSDAELSTKHHDSLVDHLLQSDPEDDNPYHDLKVLIVDDNATNHIVASSLLSRVVGSISTALNGQEALDKLAEAPYDLVLMDIHMPVMDGIETTLAIRSEPSSFQNVPIIALTADPQYQQARLCRNIGMNTSLGKPIKLTGLLQAFDEVLSPASKVANAA